MTRAVHIPLVMLVLVMTIVGLMFQASASQTMTRDIVARQMQWGAAALAAGLIVFVVPYTFLLARSWLLYGVVLALLVGVILFAPVTNGSRRWFSFGAANLQPSELMKMAFILVMARWLRYRRDYSRLGSLLVPGLIMTLPMGLVFLQPDLGTAILFVPVGLGMLYVAGARTRHMTLIVCAGLLLSVVGYTVLLQPYQRERVISTIMPERLPPAERVHKAFQIREALRSVGNGGITGEGYKQGLQNRMNRVPHRHNDFIFAVVAEETGFLGCVAYFLASLILLYCVFRVAWSTREEGGRLICVGVGLLYGSQSLVHLGVNLGVVPTTGMTLPFVSYGGSALITFISLFALVMNVGARRPALVLSGDTSKEQVARLQGVRRPA